MGLSYTEITCKREGCHSKFIYVPERGPKAHYCLDHGDEIDRELNGWTPENSID